MKNLNLYALANELNLGDPKSGTIRVPFGRWDFVELKEVYKIEADFSKKIENLIDTMLQKVTRG